MFTKFEDIKIGSIVCSFVGGRVQYKVINITENSVKLFTHFNGITIIELTKDEYTALIKE